MSARHPRDESGADLPAGVPALVAAALLAHDVPDSTAEERDLASRHVADSVSAMPDFTRFGVRVTGGVVYAVLSVLALAPYRSVPERRRTEVALKLTRYSIPLLGEFVRLTRGLGLVALHERRAASAGALPA